MASSNSTNHNNPSNKNKLSGSGSGRGIFDHQTNINTTFVQLADPSTFRSVVQSLTGSTQLHPSNTQKLPVIIPARSAASKPDSSPRRPELFKLHERRKSDKKLEMIKLNNQVGSCGSGSSSRQREFGGHEIEMNMNMNMMLVSPVSTLDHQFITRGHGSPKSPIEEEEERERVIIAEKGFYLHPRSPLSTPRGGGGEGSQPQLLPLFPLHSPK